MKIIRDTNGNEYAEVDATTIIETHDAVLFDCGLDEDKWIPKSVMEDWPDLNKNGIALIAVWFAIQEELV